MPQTAIPCILMRGGTSKGPYFRFADLPADVAVRDRVLLAAMGSPDIRQIDGLGGGDTLTSKVAMVGPSNREDVDVDYLFAQVDIRSAQVDTGPSCGNLLSGVGAFAIETGMVPARDGVTEMRVYNINTGARIDLVTQTPGGRVEYEGDARISGVPGSAAPVVCKYMDVTGSKTGNLMPTGQARDTVQGVEVSCIDVAVPCVFIRAADLDLDGGESSDEINANSGLFTRIEAIRREAGTRMGMGDVRDKVLPKVVLLSAPSPARKDVSVSGDVRSRYLTPQTCHAAHAVTGGMAVAACCLQPGTIAEGLGSAVGHETADELKERPFVVEHPSGVLELDIGYRLDNGKLVFEYAGIMRTARKLMEGSVFLPSRIWDGN